MEDGETGGLFRMLARLLVAVSPKSKSRVANFDHIANLLGQYFQIRDGYQNLCSPLYAAQKGAYEDLDEGKFSLPLIHTWHSSTNRIQLRGILQRRLMEGKLINEQKILVLDMMKKHGSLEYTLKVLRVLYDEMEQEIIR
jgi:geranylgeranyl pyrophosphate synthase